MNRFKELKVWQQAVKVAVDAYSLTKAFPSEEKFGLVSQINRSTVSIASNIAEGAGRNSKGEFTHFLGIAIGSSFELETQLIISNKLNFTNTQQLSDISADIIEAQKMLFGLQKSLKEQNN